MKRSEIIALASRRKGYLLNIKPGGADDSVRKLFEKLYKEGELAREKVDGKFYRYTYVNDRDLL